MFAVGDELSDRVGLGHIALDELPGEHRNRLVVTNNGTSRSLDQAGLVRKSLVDGRLDTPAAAATAGIVVRP